MARSLSVKIPTSALIAQVEAKIAEIEAATANYPALMKQYALDVIEYEKTLVGLAIKALSDPNNIGERNTNKPIEVGTNNYSGRSVTVTIDADALGFPEAPVKPENPNQREWIGREHIYKLDLLKKNLKVLRMTAQEEVNASTYSSVMDLL
jgi:hypothetical protein